MKYYTFLVTTQDLQTVSIFIMDDEGSLARNSVDESNDDVDFDSCRFFLLNPEEGFQEWFLCGQREPLEEISNIVVFHSANNVSLYEGKPYAKELGYHIK